MRVLDSHLHLWDPAILDYPWLEGPLLARFAEDELRAARGACAAYTAVFVQADCIPDQFLEEAAWVASLAPRIGVVGIVAGAHLHRGQETLAHLDALRANPLVVGVRHLLQSEPPGFARTAAFQAGARALASRGLTFDACVRGIAQLHDVVGLAAAVPDLRIVLDHLGKPAPGTPERPLAPTAEWRSAMRALAAHPRVSCKLSGLPAEAGGRWSAAQIAPFLDVALDAFGPQRLMLGSDWPVSAVTSATSDDPGAKAMDGAAIPTWTRAVASWAEDRGVDADAVLWGNAATFYGVAPSI